MAEDTIAATLEAFLRSDDFAKGIIASTKAEFRQESFKVELLPDGTWFVVWSAKIGKGYKSPGLIMTIPQLSERQYQSFVEQADGEEDSALVELLRSHESLIDTLAQSMRDAYEDRQAMYGSEE